MEIIRTDNPEKKAGEALGSKLRAYKDSYILLLVSGGSSFSLLEYCDQGFLGDHVTLGVLDERYSHDPSVNNYAQLTRTKFFKKAVDLGVQIIDSSLQENESLNGLGLRMEEMIQTWIAMHPYGKVVVTVGIGEDGHVAGIIPSLHTIDFETHRWFVAYTCPKEVNRYVDRVTVTYTFLRDAVSDAIVYAVGESKRKIIETLLEGNTTLETIPATILNEMSSVQLFTTIK